MGASRAAWSVQCALPSTLCPCTPPLRGSKFIVGVAGVPGSGKTSLARAVVERLNRRGTPAVNVPMVGARLAPCCCALLPRRACQALASLAGPQRAMGVVLQAYPACRCHVVRVQDGFHYFRAQLDAMPDPQLAHARRGAEWTFDARAYHACLQRIKEAGGLAGGFWEGCVCQPCQACSCACSCVPDQRKPCTRPHRGGPGAVV